MKYLVCKKQVGYGCDYTIGCGYIYECIEGDSVHDIIDKVVWPDGKDETSSLEGDMQLEEILVIPYDQVSSIDVGNLKRQIVHMRGLESKKRKHDDEMAEYLRLKEKYG